MSPKVASPLHRQHVAGEGASWSAGMPVKVGLRPGCLQCDTHGEKWPGRSETLFGIGFEGVPGVGDTVLSMPSGKPFWQCLMRRALETVRMAVVSGPVEEAWWRLLGNHRVAREHGSDGHSVEHDIVSGKHGRRKTIKCTRCKCATAREKISSKFAGGANVTPPEVPLRRRPHPEELVIAEGLVDTAIVRRF